MAYFEIKDVRKKFGETEVLKGVGFTAEKGEVISVIGSSGSGKTTLLRCINFLTAPDEGSMTLDGETLFSAPEQKKAEQKAKAKVLMGKPIPKRTDITPMNELTLESGNVTLEGEVFAVSSREIAKYGSAVLSFDMTDSTSSTGSSDHASGRMTRMTPPLASASMTLAPSSRSRALAVDLPQAIEPVRPMTYMESLLTGGAGKRAAYIYVT